jgi:hypothetical protein
MKVDPTSLGMGMLCMVASVESTDWANDESISQITVDETLNSILILLECWNEEREK